MFLLVGLGNPGEQYALTRHNAGFIFVDHLACISSTSWSKKDQFHSKIAEVNIDGQNIILCKPETFMNRSGQAVLSLMRYYKLDLAHVIVAHDELELPLARVAYKLGGGAGGHNGLRSIMQSVGGGHHRIRLGIGRPLDHRQEISDFVLQNFFKPEIELITDAMIKAAQSLPYIFAGQVEKFKQSLM